MNIRHIIALSAVVFLLMTGCSSVRVSQDYDLSYTFNDVVTIGWNAPLQSLTKEEPENNELLDQRFRQAIEHHLSQKGYLPAERPRLLVSYTYTVTSKITSTPVTTGVGLGTDRYGRYGGIDIYSSNSIEEYDQGKLEISLRSAASGKLVWLGTGTKQVYTHSTPEHVSRSVNELVEAILNQFPPGK